MKIGKVTMVNKGGLITTFNVCYAGLTILGFKLMKNNKNNSYFVSSPSIKYGNGKYFNFIKISDEVRDMLKCQILETLKDIKEE